MKMRILIGTLAALALAGSAYAGNSVGSIAGGSIKSIGGGSTKSIGGGSTK